MIDINELYNQFCSMYNTSQAGFYRPSPDFDGAAHEASLDIFNTLAANLGKSEKIDTWLMPFTKPINIVVKRKGTRSYVPKPPDFEYYASARVIVGKEKILCKEGCDVLDGDCVNAFAELDQSMFATGEVEYEEHEAELVKPGRWAAATRHVTRGPSVTRPILKLTDDGYLIEPKNVGVIVMDYLRKPARPVYAFDTEDQGENVYLRYNKEDSTQLEWSEVLMPVFLYRIGKRYGLTIKDDLVIQVSNIEKIFV